MPTPYTKRRSGQTDSDTVLHSNKFCWYIPPELRDEVIDQLHADRNALKACGLTCRAWLPRSRYHLFRSITLDPGHIGDAFRRLIHSSPIIATYVKDVEILGNSGTRSPWDSNPFISWPTLKQAPRGRGDTAAVETAAWLQRVLPSSTPSLQKVVSLKLTALTLSGSVTVALSPHFSCVTELVLDGCRGVAFADVVGLLNSLPRLKTLRLLSAQWLPGHSSFTETSQQSVIRLRRLEISRKIDVAPLVSWMLSANVHVEMVSLSCSLSGPKSVSAIRDLLHATGSTLEYLTIGFEDTRDTTDILQATHFDMTDSVRLRRLHICCSSVEHSLMLSSIRPSLSWIVILLSAAHAPHLEEITFAIRLADLRVLNLEGLDVVLSHTRFRSLRIVKFEVELHRDAPQAFNRDSVCDRMQAMHAKDVLRFEVCHSSRRTRRCY